MAVDTRLLCVIAYSPGERSTLRFSILPFLQMEGFCELCDRYGIHVDERLV